MNIRLVAALLIGLGGIGSVGAQVDEPIVVREVLSTAPLFSYEDAPATPDADDPAIWVNRHQPQRSLVFGTAKDAGMLVYDLRGRLVQAFLPPNAPQVLTTDPPTPAGPNPLPDDPCPESASGETFGRFNNVDVAYNVPLASHHGAPRADIAIVSDRGCDRIRFYRIDPSHPHGPLVDITAANVPRVFPKRYNQPSAVQPSGEPGGWSDNPLDDQNTVYGLTVAHGKALEVFVSERERGLVRQLRIVAAPGGKLTYQTTRTFLFDTSFELRDELGAPYSWTPCREAVQEEPQSEGLVFDSANETLYVAFETIGLYKLPLRDDMPKLVPVGVNQLIEPVRSFGRAYTAIEEDDEFECEYGAAGGAPGSDANAGEFLEADLEGLSVVLSVPGHTLMLASSQGDSSFHFYQIGRRTIRHLGAFLVDGVGDTDGVHYVPVPLGSRYPLGLLVVQNGAAPGDPGDFGEFEFDGATQFKYVDFRDALKALRITLRIP